MTPIATETTLHQQIETDYSLLELIDRRRAETGDPNIGSAIEAVVLARQLQQIEEDTELYAAAEEFIAAVIAAGVRRLR